MTFSLHNLDTERRERVSPQGTAVASAASPDSSRHVGRPHLADLVDEGQP